jgi:hypothetical protein
VHILGSVQNIKIARDAIVSLILGSPPGQCHAFFPSQVIIARQSLIRRRQGICPSQIRGGEDEAAILSKRLSDYPFIPRPSVYTLLKLLSSPSRRLVCAVYNDRLSACISFRLALSAYARLQALPPGAS